MRRFRTAASIGVLVVLTAGCAAQQRTGTAVSVRQAGGVPGSSTSAPPASYALTVPQAVGAVRRIVREGLSEKLGAQLAALFAGRAGAPVTAAYGISAPFYFAGVSTSRPDSKDLAGQADLALQAAVRADTNTTTLTLAAVHTYASPDPATVLRCAVATVHGAAGSNDVPVCAWVDRGTVGVVLDFTSPVTTGGGEADIEATVKRTLATRAAAEQPSP